MSAPLVHQPAVVSAAGLCEELHAYCVVHGLPQMSADDLLLEDLRTAQRLWLEDFVARWDALHAVRS